MRDPASIPLDAGDGLVHVVVESPAGASVKYAWDAAVGAFVRSRPLVAGLVYPGDWGFFPGTRAPDGDPLDALVLSDGPAYPGVVLVARVVGMLRATQSAGRRRIANHRLIAVPDRSRSHGPLRDVRALGQHALDALALFFANAVAMEGKHLRLGGWSGPREARAELARCAQAPAR